MLDAFAVVAEPSRRRILDLLCARDHCVGELVAALALSQPAVSKHLRVLKEAHLVEARASANQRFYRLTPAPLLELDAWLTPYRRMWARRLDALGDHLDALDASDAQQPGKHRRIGSRAGGKRGARRKR
jgi:DNA-binding transcriptional ArsR family regulator